MTTASPFRPCHGLNFLFLGLFFLVAAPSWASDAAILKVDIAADDLSVTVAWDTFVAANWVEVAVLDEHQNPVASRLTWPVPGDWTPTDFLALGPALQSAGFQYSVEVRDGLGQPLAEPLPFRIGYSCDGPGGPCRLKIHEGIDSTVPVEDEVLMEALDAFHDEPSGDILGDIVSSRPALSGAVISLAEQLRLLDAEHQLGSECFCTWVYFYGDSPGAETCGRTGSEGRPPSSGWALYERSGKGSGAEVAGQMRFMPEPIHGSAVAESRHTMDLQCWQISAWSDYELRMESERESTTIRWPQLQACPGQCSGEVGMSAVISHRLDGAAVSGEGDSLPTALAQARVAGSLKIADGSEADPKELPWQAAKTCFTHECPSVRGEIRVPSEGFWPTTDCQRVTGTLAGEASLSLRADRVEEWSFGHAFFQTELFSANAFAACAVEPEVTIKVTVDSVRKPDIEGDCGELEIDPWVD